MKGTNQMLIMIKLIKSRMQTLLWLLLLNFSSLCKLTKPNQTWQQDSRQKTKTKSFTRTNPFVTQH